MNQWALRQRDRKTKTEMEITKGNPSEMKNTLSETRRTSEGINRLDEAEDGISNIEDGGAEGTQAEQQQEKGLQKKINK